MEASKSQSLTQIAIAKMKRDKGAMACLAIIVAYVLLAFGVQFGLLPNFDNSLVAKSYQPPGEDFLFGSDIFGRSVIVKAIHGARIAMIMGLLITAIAIPVGVILGAVAGYFGGKVDEFVVWIYTTFSSIPDILLLLAISFVLGKGLVAVCVAIGTVTWVSTARLVRAEFMKQRDHEYVQAARALGVNRFNIIFRHILPNVMHIVIIQASLRFVYSIKSEVILTFIGVGIQDQISWGNMISDAQGELTNGVWWNFTAATVAMLIAVFAFNYFNDVLRDALDPKLRHS